MLKIVINSLLLVFMALIQILREEACGMNCLLFVAYGKLPALCSIWNLSWCIGGDFIVTYFPSKRLGGPSSSSAMMDFSDIINEQGLLDMP